MAIKVSSAHVPHDPSFKEGLLAAEDMVTKNFDNEDVEKQSENGSDKPLDREDLLDLWKENLYEAVVQYTLLSYIHHEEESVLPIVLALYGTQKKEQAEIDVCGLEKEVQTQLFAKGEAHWTAFAELLEKVTSKNATGRRDNIFTKLGLSAVKGLLDVYVNEWADCLVSLENSKEESEVFAKLVDLSHRALFSGVKNPHELMKMMCRCTEEQLEAAYPWNPKGPMVRAVVELHKEEFRETDLEAREPLPDDAYNMALLFAMNRPIHVPGRPNQPLRQFPGVLYACVMSVMMMLLATVAMDPEMFGMQDKSFTPINGWGDWRSYIPLRFVAGRMTALTGEIMEQGVVANVFRVLALLLFLGKVQDECLDRAKTMWANKLMARQHRHTFVDYFVMWGTYINPICLGLCGIATICQADDVKEVVLGSVEVMFVAEIDNSLLKLYLNTFLYVVPEESWLVMKTDEAKAEGAVAEGDFQVFTTGVAVFSFIQALCVAPFFLALCQITKLLPEELPTTGLLFWGVCCAVWLILYSWQYVALVYRGKNGKENQEMAQKIMVKVVAATVVGVTALVTITFVW
eukprot:GDKI01000407.1.p1 GENE.GDKI01000407.1~~GDKI01000407.1.p1  ORF type:complete len:592 (-),score=193.99 GDKI01000407.1:26-1747(-)